VDSVCEHLKLADASCPNILHLVCIVPLIADNISCAQTTRNGGETRLERYRRDTENKEEPNWVGGACILDSTSPDSCPATSDTNFQLCTLAILQSDVASWKSPTGSLVCSEMHWTRARPVDYHVRKVRAACQGG
jgi:hypothetical protein